jgi:hypothetical protein
MFIICICLSKRKVSKSFLNIAMFWTKTFELGVYIEKCRGVCNLQLRNTIY